MNTSSGASITKGPEPPIAVLYGTSKAALDTQTKYDSGRLAKLGVKINTINPGPFLTNITYRRVSDGAPEEPKKAMLDTFSGFMEQQIPLKRWGKLEEIVPAYLLLADNNSSGFTIGSCWVIDGGRAYYGKQMNLTKSK